MTPWSAIWGWEFYSKFTGSPKVEAYPWNEQAKSGLETLIGLSGTVELATLGVIAAIWGLIVVKRADAVVVLKAWPERTLLFVAFLSLGLSCVSHFVFVDELVAYTLKASRTEFVPDFRSFAIRYALYSQVALLVWGVIVAFFTIFSAKWTGA